MPSPKIRKIFISYRREDSRHQAARIYAALERVLPKDHIFMDIDSLKPGVDFVNVLTERFKRKRCHAGINRAAMGER